MANQLQNISQGLQAFGAGIQGNLPQFQQGQILQQEQQQAQEDRQRQLLEQRTQAGFQDAAVGLQFAETGDYDALISLGINRAQNLKNFPDADLSDTQTVTQLAIAARNGDEEAASLLIGELKGFVRDGQTRGYLEKPEEKTPYTDMGKAAADLRAGFITKEQYNEQVSQSGLDPDYAIETRVLPLNSGFFSQDERGNVSVATSEGVRLTGAEAQAFIDAAYEREEIARAERVDTDAFNANKRTFRQEEGIIQNTIQKAISDDERLNRQISRARELLDNGAGGYAQTFAFLPESEQRELNGVLTAIRSFAALGKMSELKSLSSSGATGFGALNTAELELLVNNLGSLDEFQDPAALMRTLDELEQYSNDLVGTAVEGYGYGVDLYGSDKPPLKYDRKDIFTGSGNGLTEEERLELEKLRKRHSVVTP